MKTHCNSGHQYFLMGTAYEHGTKEKEIPPPWSNEGNPGSRNKVITIPDWFWSAACCVPPKNEDHSFAIGYYSTSNDEKAEVIWTKLHYLEERIETNSDYSDVQLFYGDRSTKKGCNRDDHEVYEWLKMQKAVELATSKWKESPTWRMNPDFQLVVQPTNRKRVVSSSSPAEICKRFRSDRRKRSLDDLDNFTESSDPVKQSTEDTQDVALSRAFSRSVMLFKCAGYPTSRPI